jgi:hypothetical protein
MRHLLALTLLLLSAAAALAEIGGRSLSCASVTAAPACLAAAEVWGLQPSGGLVILPDRLRLAGVERRTGDDRAVILDLALPRGEVLAVTPLDRPVPDGAMTAFSPDGAVLLVIDPEPPLEADALPPRRLQVFDATGRQIGMAEGVAVAAMADAMDQNRLVFGDGRVTLDLAAIGGTGAVSVIYAAGAVAGAEAIPDGAWLYDALFDRDRGWYQDGMAIIATYARDGSPATVVRQDAAGAVTLLGATDAGAPGSYDVEYFGPVLSPDGSRLAVLQVSDAAPGPILLAMDMATGVVFWRAVVGRSDQRQAQYRWAADGRLVVLQPDDVLPDASVLTVFSPGP